MHLHHVAFIVSSLDDSARFYEDILGLEREPRPDLGFPGLFYGVGRGQQIHLMQIDNPHSGCELPDHGGRDFHVALATESLDVLISKLEVAGIKYTRSRSGRAAIFFRDPDGNAVEVIEKA